MIKKNKENDYIDLPYPEDVLPPSVVERVHKLITPSPLFPNRLKRKTKLMLARSNKRFVMP